jgi:hypothetical protein
MQIIVSGPGAVVPSTTNPRIVTRLEFFNRFTDDELAAIYTASKTNINVEILLDKFKLAEEIVLDDVKLISGIDLLVSLEILTEIRKEELLIPVVVSVVETVIEPVTEEPV